jgi:methionine salvage enolase-phosphatase E1
MQKNKQIVQNIYKRFNSFQITSGYYCLQNKEEICSNLLKIKEQIKNLQKLFIDYFDNVIGNKNEISKNKIIIKHKN